MRLALVSLALLALVPVVAGDACVPICEVKSHQLAGFVPVVTMVVSGSTVVWTELDGAHMAVARDFCFNTAILKNDPGAATFAVRDGVLYAASEGDPEKPCLGAIVTPDGAAVLEYYCPVHPNMRNAQLVVK